MLSEKDRAKSIEDIDAILTNEGFDPSQAPDWYKELKRQYIAGEIESQQMTEAVLKNLANNFKE